jgi:hypothetical protein
MRAPNPLIIIIALAPNLLIITVSRDLLSTITAAPILFMAALHQTCLRQMVHVSQDLFSLLTCSDLWILFHIQDLWDLWVPFDPWARWDLWALSDLPAPWDLWVLFDPPATPWDPWDLSTLSIVSALFLYPPPSPTPPILRPPVAYILPKPPLLSITFSNCPKTPRGGPKKYRRLSRKSKKILEDYDWTTECEGNTS